MKNVPLPVGTKLAICCTYRDLVAGKGFLANVEMSGRLLAVIEDEGEVWVHGVQPSGLAECAQTLLEAHAAFRKAYSETLYDIASDAGTFQDFHVRVNALMHTAEPLTMSWREAVKNLDKRVAELLGLPITQANSHEPSIRVTEVIAPTEMTPALNQLDETPRVVLKQPKAA